MKLIIPGRPVPAVRMTQRSKFKNKQALRYLEYKERIGWEAKAAKIPKFHGRNIHVNAVAYLCAGPEPDVDNLGKAFLDGLNAIVWDDDRQVRKLTVEKRFVENKEAQRVEIEIKEVESA